MVALHFNENGCKGCALCVDACPKKLLRLSPERMNDKGHHVAEIQTPEKCAGCCNCALMCPDCVITIEKSGD